MVTFGNITLLIPGLNTRVTDWYCPKPDVVMKQDIARGNAVSIVQYDPDAISTIGSGSSR